MIYSAGQAQATPSQDADPATVRGANWLYEALRVGPEETGLHFLSLPYAERRQLLEDIHELIGFTREMWSAFNQIHLGMRDLPPEAPK